MSKPDARQSPEYLADVLIRNCVGYCLDAEEAAITLLGLRSSSV